MATSTRSFVFAGNTESFAFTDGGGDVAGSWDSGVGHDAVGSLKCDGTGANIDESFYWELDLTWENLNVPSGGTITALELTDASSKVVTATNVTDIDIGPFELRNSGGSLIGTLYAGRLNLTSVDGDWVDAGSQSSVAVSSHASNTAIKLRWNGHISTSVGPGTSAIFNLDDIDLQVTYTPDTSSEVANEATAGDVITMAVRLDGFEGSIDDIQMVVNMEEL